MASMWFWLRKGSIRKNLPKVPGAMTSGGAYGTQYRFDQEAPDTSETFTGRGFTWAEVEAYQAKAKSPATAAADAGLATITDHLGQQWKGPISDLSWEPALLGGSVYWQLSLTLDNPVKL
mgnify:CR=1 FL=1